MSNTYARRTPSVAHRLPTETFWHTRLRRGNTGKLNALSRSMNEVIQTISRDSQEEPLLDAVNAVPSDPSTILVIDDDSLVLQTVKTLLVKRGFNVLAS